MWFVQTHNLHLSQQHIETQIQTGFPKDNTVLHQTNTTYKKEINTKIATLRYIHQQSLKPN